MNTLQPAAIIIPIIALLLMIYFYWLLQKKAFNKKDFKRFTIIMLLLAFLLNFAWEVIQMPLYKDAGFSIEHITFCALASVADAIMVLLIYFSFAFIYKSPLWVQNLTSSRILMVMLAGGLGAVAAEKRHLSSGTWAYDPSMPIIPILYVGLSPILQFMVLPVCIYYISLLIKNKLS